MIKIVKVLNNNAIVAEDIRKNTLVALGAGIAFRQKVGDWIADSKIEKAFFPEDEKKLLRLLTHSHRLRLSISTFLTKLFLKRKLALARS